MLIRRRSHPIDKRQHGFLIGLFLSVFFAFANLYFFYESNSQKIIYVSNGDTPSLDGNEAQPSHSTRQSTKSEASFPNKTIYAWVHIPKTGGSSSYDSYMKPLLNIAKNQSTIDVYPKLGPPRTGPYDWNSPGCARHGIATHCAGSEIIHCLKHKIHPELSLDVKLVTVIRHPVARVVSEYFWWKKNEKGGVWTHGMFDNRENMTAWVLDPTNTAHNRQAFYFLLNSSIPEDSHGCTPFRGNLHLNYIQDYYQSPTRFNELDLPMSVLDRYAFVGVLDEPAKSANAYQDVFGLEPLQAGLDSHRSTRKGFDAAILELIEERNKLDLQLYHAVQKRYGGYKL